MAISFSIDAISDAITSNKTILTANNRQRNQILQAYNERQVSAALQKNSWRKPAIYTLQQWIKQQWQNLCFKDPVNTQYTIADTWQRTLLWEQAIAKTAVASTLLQSKQMANMADTALSTLANWQYDITTLNSALQQDASNLSNTEIFIKWAKHFNLGLEKANLITDETARSLLLEAFNTKTLNTHKNVVLYGFDELVPLTQALLNTALPDHTLLTATPAHQPNVQQTFTDNSSDEIRAAALWASNQLTENPNATVGIIVPALGQIREKVERIFSEVFEPQMADPTVHRYTPALNFSAGVPLGTTPIIFTALELLALHNNKFSTDRLCNLLQSPFWAEDVDSNQENTSLNIVFQTALMSKLRDQNTPSISSSDLRYHAQKLAETMPEIEQTLNHKLQTAAAIFQQRNKKYDIQTWFEKINTLLTQLGWPGSRRLDSLEYQQITLWNELQEALLSVDRVQAVLTFSEVTGLLKNTADKMPFQPQTSASPIQILGELEGAGLNFTHCWVMGMHNQQWPNAPSPNPLLPYEIQRELNMPHASAARELLYAERLTEGYKTCANEIIFSYATNHEGEALSPSQLLHDIDPIPLNELLTNHLVTKQQQHYQDSSNTQTLEAINCTYGPAISSPQVKGGAGLFKDQAICPFTAFAKRRLGAQNPMQSSIGFSAIERGNMLHDALADIWLALNDQSTLLSTTNNDLSTLVITACKAAVKKVAKTRGITVGQRFCQIETERLSEQVLRWLEREKERQSFSIHAIEEKQSVKFAGLEFDLRVDRIDLLPSGKYLIIDYKTGESSPNSWKENNFTDPQLPLYACITPEQNAATAFVVINANKQTMQGWEDDNQYLKLGKPEQADWHAQIEQWQHTLESLAESFSKGYSAVEYAHHSFQDYDAHLNGLTRILETDDVQQYVQATQEGEC